MKPCCGLLPLWLLLTTPAVAQESSASELLESAIFAEETLGDLDGAIEIYERIVTRGEVDRAYLARAQYRLSLCYVKKGERAAAIASLRKLVQSYPDQEELLRLATAKLSELGVEAPGGGVVLRQVWANAASVMGSPSPDGRYLSTTNWDTGHLELHDLETGEDRPLTAEGGWKTDEFAEFSVVSRDGKQVAYAWFNKQLTYDLRVVGLDGSDRRVLFADSEVTWLRPLDWSPDGESILVHLSNAGGPSTIALVSTRTGDARTLSELAWLDGLANFSPDGSSIAYSRRTDAQLRGDVFLLSLEDMQEHPLVEHPAEDLMLGWTPDGGHLLFASDRRGSWDVWAQPIDGTRPRGAPRLLRQGLGDARWVGELTALGLTSSGALYFGITTDFRDVYVADCDPATGRITSLAREVVQRSAGRNTGPDWSRDGDTLAYLSKRAGTYRIVLQSTETQDESELVVSPDLWLVHDDGRLRWSPDGRAFLVFGRDREEQGGRGLFMIDARRGEITAIARDDPGGGVLLQPQWSPDGKTVFFERRGAGPDTADSGFVALELESGRERMVVPGIFGPVALAPDGDRIAFVTRVLEGVPRDLVVASVDGAERRVLLTTPYEFFGKSLAWTPDGRQILFGKNEPDGQGTTSLWRIPAAGGEPQELGLRMPQIRQLRIHPDGNLLAFVAGDSRLDVWVMESYLHELERE